VDKGQLLLLPIATSTVIPTPSASSTPTAIPTATVPK